MAESSSISLKLLIDTTKVKRVLFAEAGKDFVDFLFHILSLPVATIIRLLQDQGIQGPFPNLFQSLENLSNDYIQPNKTKDAFLKPVVPVPTTSLPLPALSNYEPTHNNFYGCSQNHRPSSDLFGGSSGFYVSDDPSAVCPACRKKMIQALSYVKPSGGKEADSGDEGLVKGVVTYMVMDDLVVKPMSTISAVTLLNKFEIKELGALEEKVVSFGMDEAVKLLKVCVGSKNVLTEIFC